MDNRDRGYLPEFTSRMKNLNCTSLADSGVIELWVQNRRRHGRE